MSSVKEMYMVPKDLYFSSFAGLDERQRGKLEDINVEQLNRTVPFSRDIKRLAKKIAMRTRRRSVTRLFRPVI